MWPRPLPLTPCPSAHNSESIVDEDTIPPIILLPRRPSSSYILHHLAFNPAARIDHVLKHADRGLAI